MKKTIHSVVLALVFVNVTTAQTQQFFTADVDRFWQAYDKVQSTTDTLLQINYLNDLYIHKASEGLKSLLQVRNYTVKEYRDAIHNYPKFWASLRANTQGIPQLYTEIETDIAKLQVIYPTLKPAAIYFAIGVFRTGGTILGNQILIGTESVLADETAVLDELPNHRQHYFKTTKPKQNIALMCTHEHIHTQQKLPHDNLLSYCLYEGVAEYISCLATGKKSNTPAIEFGKNNHANVIHQFVKEMYSDNVYNWLWGENANDLKERDLGYYIGYAICEKYYTMADNKTKAVQELIELDYTNEKEVERIVDATKILPKTLQELWDEYDQQRPIVVNIKPLCKNKKIKSGTIQLAITFSQEMDTNYRGFNYGPLGPDYVYEFKKVIGWTNNNKTFTIEVNTKNARKYQAYITSNFRSKSDFMLKPFLIEFETKRKRRFL